jgi:competence protein ComEA
MKISLKRLYKEYPYESGLLSLAGLIILASLIAVILTNQPVEAIKTTTVPSSISTRTTETFITVDVSGSVKNPDIYSFTYTPRINDILKRAGGLTDAADTEYIARNFNHARFVSDQEKIYFPSKTETQRNVFTEDSRTLQYLSVVQTSSSPASSSGGNNSSQLKININSASADELDSLEGIGPTFSKAIIDHRPYKNINELVSKKVLKQATFTKIKDSISL